MYQRFFKRLIDIVLSFLGLAVLVAPMVILAVIVKLDSKGPVLFWQKRVGLHKETFLMPKFRTMYTQTPAEMPTHLLADPAQWITRVGRVYRKLSIDELPQLWSILTGKMSIIGPRPALWNQFDLIAERDKYGANNVRPGLTGWAQINGYRGDTSIKRRIECDIFYIENWTMSFDIKIMFLTLFKGFINKNAY